MVGWGGWIFGVLEFPDGALIRFVVVQCGRVDRPVGCSGFENEFGVG